MKAILWSATPTHTLLTEKMVGTKEPECSEDAEWKEKSRIFQRKRKTSNVWKDSVFQCQSNTEMFKVNSFPENEGMTCHRHNQAQVIPYGNLVLLEGQRVNTQRTLMNPDDPLASC